MPALYGRIWQSLNSVCRDGTSLATSSARNLTLGRVDELFDDNPHGNEMDQSQKGLAQFLIPCGNTSKLLEIVEEPFYFLTELVEVFIIV